MLNNTLNHCSRCNDGYPLPEKEAAAALDGAFEMYLSVDDGKVCLTAVPDDPYYEFGIAVRFCPWCGRKLHPKTEFADPDYGR